MGFHLSDGTIYTHLNGDEYEDIVAAWDWNLIPGTTVDYGGTPLDWYASTPLSLQREPVTDANYAAATRNTPASDPSSAASRPARSA